MDVLFEHSLPALGLWSTDAEAGKESVFGALLFWGYIAAALYLIYDLTRTVIALKKISRILKYGYSPAYVWTFTILGLLSFASASWNMLEVLVQSYQAWADAAGIVAPQRLFGQASLLGPDRVAVHPWAWSSHSTPFRSFAQEITADPARWTWAQGSLGITLVVAYWMGFEGRKGKPLPNLWKFFALLQILPASVTLNFFIVALLFTPTATRQQPVLRAPAVWVFAGIAYFFLLVEASQEHGKPYIIPIVLLARLLLFAPLVLGVTYVNEGDAILEKVSPLQLFDLPLAFGALAVWAVAHSGYWASQEHGIEGTFDARNAHPAVTTLAYDMIQCVITAVAWFMSSPWARAPAQQAPAAPKPEGTEPVKTKKSK